MLQLNDFECPTCGVLKELYIDHTEKPICDKCNTTMIKLFTNMRFELKYNPKTDVCAWGNEGYAASQYWRDVKKAREDGHKVKGANEK